MRNVSRVYITALHARYYLVISRKVIETLAWEAQSKSELEAVVAELANKRWAQECHANRYGK